MSSNSGVIPFKLDFNPKDLKTTKYTATTVNQVNGNTSKVSMEVPIFRTGGSKMEFLYMLLGFRKAEATLAWTNGATLYANFQNQMEDTSEWDTVSQPFPNSVNGFNDAITAYLVIRFPADAWVIHRNFVMGQKKGMKDSPIEFMSRVNFHDRVLSILPGHPGAGAPAIQMTDYDKKHLLYDAVPEDYRNSFRRAGLVLSTIPLNVSDYKSRLVIVE